MRRFAPWVTKIMIVLVGAAWLGCSGSSEPAKRKPTVRTERSKKAPRARKPKRQTTRHSKHSHSHGDHPHPRDEHHHHPHPHPHLDGPDGHHHPH